jgi:16S rRNA (guanine(966)-N(2))-methyltransferase RsmD
MRVIAGQFRSRTLRSLPGMDIRPTLDRVRETLFNVLTAGNPAALEGTTWIDLYAGTGAVGIEAISRGAGMVYFVESAADAADLIRSNLLSLKIGRGFQILQKDATRAIRGLTTSADFVFLDPPYRLEEEYQRSLSALAKSNLLKPETIVIAEHPKKADPSGAFSDLRRYRTLVQGDAALSFYRKGA